MTDIESIPIAIRVYPEAPQPERPSNRRKRWRIPDEMLVFDTETTIDETQRLTFGSYRFIVKGHCLEEGLFYASDLPKSEREVLERYASTRRADVLRGRQKRLRLLTLAEFLKKFYKAAYKGRFLVVAFNFPFDISRIAGGFVPARGRFAGGFSLGLWTYGKESKANRYRPRIGIKHIDSKRALKGFTGRKEPDKEDLIPEGSLTGELEEAYKFRGHFLDLRTLAFALTDRSYTLKTACEDFGVEHGKIEIESHGLVTPEYIDYNRGDVRATCELAEKLLQEYERHPIALQATKAYSPASIGKAYLRQMGLTPILERQPDFPRKYLGYAQTAFFGGRTSAHIRKVAVPVVYTDFLSMYPTVNSLMGLWRFVIAKEIKVVDHCQAEVLKFLRRLRPDDLFNPSTWQRMTFFVRLIPNGDVLPCRCKFSNVSNDWQVGLDHLYAANDDVKDALWFSLPDVVASVLLTKRIPTIVDAFRIEAQGQQPGLEPVKLRGAIEVNPAHEDFFKVVIEQRKRVGTRTDLSETEKSRLDKALKVLANSASYGIYAEMNRQESDTEVSVMCHGIDEEPFSCRVSYPDVPGAFCFPPLASLITGAARLMLALLEYSVQEVGGTYAMEDTDSMAIVATERGGSMKCGKKPIHARSWEQVEDIADKFEKLNPYNREAVPGSILKIETDNFDAATRKQRQLYCVAISAKRYALFLLDENGEPVLLRATCPHCGVRNKPPAIQCKKCDKPVRVNNEEDRWSEHGLGHLLNPIAPLNENRDWIAQAWQNITRRVLGLRVEPFRFESAPAIGRVTVSSPAVIRPLASLNEGKRYAQQIKPFNFLLTCHVRAFGHPPGADPERFHLIAPYEIDSTKWLNMEWIDQYSGKTHRITTSGAHGSRRAARVKTYGDVLEEYEYHPESKCADADGKPCKRQTVGLLQRRHVRIDQIKAIGKESNLLEEVGSGLIHSPEAAYTEYPDPRRDEWQTKVLPALRQIPLSRLMKESGLSRRALIYARSGRRRPHPKHQEVLAAIVKKLQPNIKTSPNRDRSLIVPLPQ